MGNKSSSRRSGNFAEDGANSEDELMAGLAMSGSADEESRKLSLSTASERGHDRDSMSRIDPELEAGSSRRSVSHAESLEGRNSEEKGPGYWAQVKMGYAEAVNAIIRPPRAEYSMAELGPKEFDIMGLRFRRTDFVRRNRRGLRLHCSWWEPVPEERPMEKLPCCVYMHGNSSCRGESLEVLPLVLNMGCTLLSFDFCGCGMSEGDFISLGWYERDDCECVVEYLRASGTVSLIGLWGRSMGAATALMHGHRDNTIAAMILDSSFASLEMLVYELYKRAELKYVPKFMVGVALRVVRSTILKRAGFDILNLRPCDNVEKCHIPAIFVCAKGDRFIHPAHSEKIYAGYVGEYKNIIRIEGDHNTNRPQFCMDSISIFLYQWLCKPTGLTESFLKKKRKELVGARPGLMQGGRGEGPTRRGLGSGFTRLSQGLHGGQDHSMDNDQDLQRVLMLSLMEEQRRQEEEAQRGGKNTKKNEPKKRRKARKRRKKAKKKDVGEGANDRSSDLEDEARTSYSSSDEDDNNDEFRQEHSDAIAQLAGMGFDDEAALAALRATGGDLQTSVQLLLASRSSVSYAPTGTKQTNTKSTHGGRGKIAGRLLAAVPQDTRPDAAPINIFGKHGGAGAEKESAAE